MSRKSAPVAHGFTRFLGCVQPGWICARRWRQRPSVNPWWRLRFSRVDDPDKVE
jgi:hypothetical protein